MAKEPRPAMLFYGKDFYDDLNVLAMTYAEQGMYHRLIWLCWSEGSVPDDAEAIATILKVPDPAAFGQSFNKLRKCFRPDNGQLVHGKVEKIRAEVTQFSKQQSAKALRGWEKRRLTQAGDMSEVCHGNAVEDAKRMPSSASSSASSSATATAKEEQHTSAPQGGARLRSSSSQQKSKSPFSEVNATAEQAAWFEQFWQAFWLRKSRQRAFEVFVLKIQSREMFERVMSAVKALSAEMLSREPQRRCYPETFLAEERWSDEPALPAKLVIPKIDDWN